MQPAIALRPSLGLVANWLTMLRVVMIPGVLWLLADSRPRSNYWAAVLYTLATITDALDGWLARRSGTTSLLGKFLDPLADKILVLAVMVYLVDLGRAPAWVVVVILARELAVTGLRTLAMSEGIVLAAGQGGKEKTALQMVALLLLILGQSYRLDFLFFEIQADLARAGLYLLYASAFFAFTSAISYVNEVFRRPKKS